MGAQTSNQADAERNPRLGYRLQLQNAFSQEIVQNVFRARIFGGCSHFRCTARNFKLTEFPVASNPLYYPAGGIARGKVAALINTGRIAAQLSLNKTHLLEDFGEFDP